MLNKKSYIKPTLNLNPLLFENLLAGESPETQVPEQGYDGDDINAGTKKRDRYDLNWFDEGSSLTYDF